MAEITNILKNGSFSSISINSGWHVPNYWQVKWSKEFIGTLTLESVGALYNANNAIRFGYENTDEDYYDTAYTKVFAPGLYQGFNLADYDLTNMDRLTFTIQTCLDDVNYADITESTFDFYLYDGYLFDETNNIYEVHNSSTFTDYKVRRDFTVTASSKDWQVFTFDIDLKYLTGEVYIFGITPHVHISGVRNDNQIMDTHIVIDNASLELIPKKDETVDKEDTGIIKNGSFTNWEAGMPCDWFPVNTDILGKFNVSQTNAYDRKSSLIIEAGRDGYSSRLDESQIIPGLYQLMDLSEYEYGATITFNYSVRPDNLNQTYSTHHYMDFYVYRVVYNKETGKYVPIGGYDSFIFGETSTVKSSAGFDWKNYTHEITLNQGYYYVGFTPRTSYSELEGEKIPTTDHLFVAIDDFSGAVKEVEPTIVYGDIIKNGSFEYSNPLNNWGQNKVVAHGRTDSRQDLIMYDLGITYIDICYETGILVEDIEALHYGLNQVVLSQSNSRAILSFWHKSASNEEMDFRVCVYEIEFAQTGEPTIIEPAILEDNITANENWNNHTGILDVKYNTYYIIVVYPPYEIREGELGLSLDKFSLTTFESQASGHSGSFNNPFTEEDGLFTCNSNGDGTFTPSFYPYDSLLHPMEYFLKINTKYYCTTGTVDDFGRFVCYRDRMVDSPAGLTGMRYFFPNGQMAVSTTFEYQGDTYEAGFQGALTKCVANILNIWTEPNIESLVLKTTDSKTIEFKFEYQGFDVTLNTEIQNTAIATITNLVDGESSNRITVYGKSMGQTTLRVYFRNPSGYVAEKIIQIIVKDDIPEDYNNGIIYMAYEENAVRVGGSFAIDYFIVPDYITDLPIEWSSSNENIATVDMYGNVYGVSSGDCVIKATNTYTGEFASCTVYVGTPIVASSIRVSDSTLAVSISDSKRVTAKVLDSLGNSAGVVQDVQWESSNTKIATVNKYGYITGIARGVVEVKCTCVSNKSISATITVNIVGTSIEIQDIELDCYEIKFNPQNDNNTVMIKHRFVPSNTSSTGVIWESSNEDVVKVTQSGTVYLTPGYNDTYTNIATITCRSTSRPSVYKECSVDVSIFHNNPITITAFDTTLNTCVGRTIRIDYDIFHNHNHANLMIEEVSITAITTNTVSLEEDSNGKYISFVANETGTFEVELYTRREPPTGGVSASKKFTVNVFAQDLAPQIKDDLKVLYALQNDTCILRCKVEDQIDRLNDINFYIDFGDGNGYETVYDYIEPKGTTLYQYFFISGYQLNPGTTYQTKIKAVDSQGLETVTNTVPVTIPSSGASKESLAEAKADYDSAMEAVLNILSWLIPPNEYTIPDQNKAEFFVYYRLYCSNYDNLRDMLDQCIDSINSQISTSQAEMAMLSDTLNSDGVSVATYSANDYTNSNYQNITDLDYYQSICIKALAQKVLELEARLNELTNNNN